MYEDEIRIRVEPNYMAAESSAAAERYAFPTASLSKTAATIP